jgi:hypothetical protein
LQSFSQRNRAAESLVNSPHAKGQSDRAKVATSI